MMASVLKALGYVFGVIGGASLVMGVIVRLAKGPGVASTVFIILPRSYVLFAQACLLFAIALGVATLLERKTKEKK